MPLRTCDDCKHKNESFLKYPCAGCFNEALLSYSNWEAEEKDLNKK